MNISRRSAAGAAVALAVALAGCGSSGPSVSDFKKSFAAEKAQFRQLGTEIGRAIQNAPQQTDAALATEFKSFSARANQTAAKLRQIKAPSKYTSQLSGLAADFDTVGADLARIYNAALAHDAKAAKTATETFITDAAKLKSADNALSGALGLPKS